MALSLRLAGRGPAPCGTGLRAALEPRRRRRRRPREWQSVRPGPERASERRGSEAHPKPRSASSSAAAAASSPPPGFPFTLPAAAQPFTPGAGQRPPPLLCSCRGRWRGRGPGLGRSRAPGSGRRRLHMIRKRPHQQGGGGGGSQGRHRHSSPAPGTLTPCAARKVRPGAGSSPLPARSCTPRKAGFGGQTPTRERRGQATTGGEA